MSGLPTAYAGTGDSRVEYVKTARIQDLRPLGPISLAIAMVAATFVAATTWERVKVKPEARSIEITGSAKKRIVSDLIEWSASIEASAPDRMAAYKQLHDHASRAQEFLTARGVATKEIWASSVSVDAIYETEYIGTGEDRIARQNLKGYMARQSVVVRSADVPLVEKMSREITELLEADPG